MLKRAYGIIGIAACILSLLLLSSDLIAQVPSPHGIAGWIFQSDGSTQVPLGTKFRVNDTNSSFFIQDVTSVPVPGNTGRYSVSVAGSNNDTVLIHAWTSVQYGQTIISLQGDRDNVNVTINAARPPEANVTIIYPSSGASFNVSDPFWLNGTFILLGGQNGFSCNVTLTISDQDVFNISSEESFVESLGNVNLGVKRTVAFNITSSTVGLSDFTISGTCSNAGLNFAGEHVDTITSVTSTLGNVPTVALILPANNTLNKTSNNITFSYSVTHSLAIDNCSIMVNGARNKTQYSPETGIQNNISIVLDNGDYNWSVLCYDLFGAPNQQDTHNLSIAVFFPTAYAVTVDSPIDLEAGTMKQVVCNASVRDLNGIADVISVNATLFDRGRSASTDADDPNWHYTNASCASFQAGSITANYSCTFWLQYYAYNGTWSCNVTIRDQGNSRNSTDQSTTVNQLVALSADATLDFGAVVAGEISQEFNLTLTNVGNAAFNLSVNGFGEIMNDNLSMACANGQSIPINRTRFAIIQGLSYGIKTLLSSAISLVNGILFPKRTLAGELGSSQNKTFWAIQVPQSTKTTSCNGTVLLYATTA